MSKVAKLVCVSLMTRVIVDDNATDEQILETARGKFLEKVQTELGENLEEITDDTECPYGTMKEETLYEILGYKTHEDFNNCRPLPIEENITSIEEALTIGKKHLASYATIKVQSMDREEIEILEK